MSALRSNSKTLRASKGSRAVRSEDAICEVQRGTVLFLNGISPGGMAQYAATAEGCARHR